jgi:hypothetical protein
MIEVYGYYLLATLAALAGGWGWLRAAGLLRDRTLGEQLGLCYFAGLTSIAFLVWVAGLRSFPVGLSFWPILGFQVLPLTLGIWRWRTDKAVVDKTALVNEGRWLLWEWGLVVMMGCTLAFVFLMNRVEMMRTADAFTFSMGLAKKMSALGSHSGIELRLGYPKFPGMALWWFADAGNHWHEFRMNYAHFNYLLLFVVWLFSALRTLTGRGVALMVAFVVCNMPLLVNHSILIGYTDQVIMIPLTMVGLYACRYSYNGRRADLIIGILCAVTMPFIKPEGLVPYIVFAFIALALAVFHRRQKPSIKFIWLCTIGAMLSGIAVISVIGIVWNDGRPPFIPAAIWLKIEPGFYLWKVRKAALQHFGWSFGTWSVLGPCVALMTPFVIYRERKSPALPLAIYCMLLLLSFIYLFGFSHAHEWLLDGTTVNRLFMQILPTMLILIGVSLTNGQDKVPPISENP